MYDFKIDLVYLWCDGNDAKWRAKRAKYIDSVDSSDAQTFCDGRIADNDDLLYSLRSVEMYAPWINHIFIITDAQTPKWLDTSNPKVTIVDHKDIFPAEALPLYNTSAMEMAMHKIEGLSEHFLFSNDDAGFARAASPDFFFTSDGKPINRFFRSGKFSRKRRGTYMEMITNVTKRINEDFAEDYNLLRPQHQIDAYCKSYVAECAQKYQKWIDETFKNRFRSGNDMHRHIFALYSIATGRGVMKASKSKSRLTEIILKLFPIPIKFDSYCFSFHKGRYKRIEREIEVHKPTLVCFNDTEKVTDSDRAGLIEVYKRLYPQKSQFEK